MDGPELSKLEDNSITYFILLTFYSNVSFVSFRISLIVYSVIPVKTNNLKYNLEYHVVALPLLA